MHLTAGFCQKKNVTLMHVLQSGGRHVHVCMRCGAADNAFPLASGICIAASVHKAFLRKLQPEPVFWSVLLAKPITRHAAEPFFRQEDKERQSPQGRQRALP